ncbi:unnamed protein product [Nezara viridula]|uniref:Uncharacterized protein n=1 Tax=Nezara viridula TaxID=85310 RepID=A0A9P0H9H6_NEZVI|nr:unnamed protein product [Nezara viridula]
MMATCSYFSHFQPSLSVSACPKTAAIAIKREREIKIKEEEERNCWVNARAEMLCTMESTTKQTQLIIGSAAGVLSGYLAKEWGKGWGVAVGVALFAIRLAGYIRNRTNPCSLCRIKPEIDCFGYYLEEMMAFYDRNIFVVPGFIGGFIIAYRMSESSDDYR